MEPPLQEFSRCSGWNQPGRYRGGRSLEQRGCAVLQGQLPAVLCEKIRTTHLSESGVPAYNTWMWARNGPAGGKNQIHGLKQMSVSGRKQKCMTFNTYKSSQEVQCTEFTTFIFMTTLGTEAPKVRFQQFIWDRLESVIIYHHFTFV